MKSLSNSAYLEPTMTDISLGSLGKSDIQKGRMDALQGVSLVHEMAGANDWRMVWNWLLGLPMSACLTALGSNCHVRVALPESSSVSVPCGRVEVDACTSSCEA